MDAIRTLVCLLLLAAATRADGPFIASEAPITGVAVAADSRQLALAVDGTVQVWQLDPKKHVASLRGHKGEVTALAFSPDSAALVSGGEDKSLRWWEPQTGKQSLKVDLAEAITRLAFAPDGKTLAVGDSTGAIRILDAASGKLQTTLAGHRRGITDLDFAPDGKTLASGSADRSIVLWDLQTEKPRHVLREHRGWVSGLGYAADGTSLVSAGRDQRVLLWDAPSGTCFQTFEEWDGAVQALAIRGPVIASAGLGKVIHLRHEQLGKEIALLDSQAEPIQFLAFTRAGKKLISAGRQRIDVWDVSAHLKEGPARPDHFTAKLLDDVWSDLASNDDAVAVRTVRSLTRLPELAVPFLDTRIAAVAPATIRRIDKLIADLDSDQFDVREEATQELPRQGYLADQAMRAVLKGNPSLESKRRIERILNDMPDASSLQNRELRGVDVLERIASKQAKEVLTRLAGGDAKARLTEGAKGALRRLEGK